MRISYLINGVGVSGGCRIVLEHLGRLQARGHECSLITLDGSTSAPWFPQINFQILGRNLWESTARRSNAVVATEANTMVPVMSVETNARKYNFLQMRESCFFLFQNPTWAGAVEENYRKAKGILQPIVIGQWLKDFLEDEYGYENVPIIPNGISREMFYPDPAFPKLEGKKRVLIEGFSSSEAKDVRMMAYKTVDAYRQRYPGTIELWGFSQASCYADFDRYWRFPNQDLIRQLYSSSDILLKATKYEGRTALAHLEAMACGCLVNAAAGEGDDDLHHKFNCLKVKYENFQGFFNNFVRLLTDEELCKQLIENGLEFVKEKLDWDPIITRLEEIYSG